MSTGASGEGFKCHIFHPSVIWSVGLLLTSGKMVLLGLESCMWDLSEETKACGCVEDGEVGRKANMTVLLPLKTQLSGTCILSLLVK